MTSTLLFIIAIIVLTGYIIYLHIQLTKKNIYINSTVNHLSEIEKNWTAEEMMRFLHEIKKVQHFNSFFSEKLFEEKPISFLLENHKTSRIYIHYTKDRTDAENIINEGFRFADSFYKTALPVTGDKLDLLMKHNSRKSFGDYLIVISISAKVFDKYSEILAVKGFKGVYVENILTDVSTSKNENSDTVYILPAKFVKGFINHFTGEIVSNPEFDPGYDSENFGRNIEVLEKTKINLS